MHALCTPDSCCCQSSFIVISVMVTSASSLLDGISLDAELQMQCCRAYVREEKTSDLELRVCSGLGCRGQALQGSMFWCLDVAVYSRDAWPGPYAVRPEHSTFGIVREHAAQLRNIIVTTAPDPLCMREHKTKCYVPQLRGIHRRYSC